MSIWNRPIEIDGLNRAHQGNSGAHIGMEITEIGDDYIRGTIPVDHRTIQPFGILHGGMSVVLAESLGSIASNMVVDISQYYCVGLDINANHIRSVRAGKVIGTARPIHLGSTTHVWEIRIEDEQGRLTCVSRLTMAVLAHNKRKS